MPLAVVSNDDGISSFYLRVLVDALKENFDVVVAAPKREQSWIGRAMTRRTPVSVEKYKELPCEAWSIDGTPCDCVNIAMQHLMHGRKPDIVVSGINIGYNAGIPFILSSGTLGAAIEGSVWGIRSLAVSQKVPSQYFTLLHSENRTVPADIEPDIRAAAVHAAKYAYGYINAVSEHYIVHNLNYPARVDSHTPMEHTKPSRMLPQGLFDMADDGVCMFHFNPGTPVASSIRTDQDCMVDGTISLSVLDFSKIGQ